MSFEESRLAAFVASYHDVNPSAVSMSFNLLRGGLRSPGVVRVNSRFSDRSGQLREWTFVAKRLDGIDRREASVYRNILEPAGWDGSPRFFGAEPVSPDVCYLYIEYVPRSEAWPWANSNSSALMLEKLAELHIASAGARLAELSPQWSYEAELVQSALTTWEMYEHVVEQEELAGLRPYRSALRRVTAALPDLRYHLLHEAPLPVTFIHGDTHPGNALMRTQSEDEEIVLLDWGNARTGSPLEDVASWLQSLGYWEPEAKRRHDTLFRRYLEARSLPSELTRNLRNHYWLAGMCNILSGSLRYHLWIAGGWEAPSRAKAESLSAARDQLRVIRRADILWR